MDRTDESVRKLYIIRNELQNTEQTGAKTSAFKSCNISTERNKFRNYYEMEGVLCFDMFKGPQIDQYWKGQGL